MTRKGRTLLLFLAVVVVVLGVAGMRRLLLSNVSATFVSGLLKC